MPKYLSLGHSIELLKRIIRFKCRYIGNFAQAPFFLYFSQSSSYFFGQFKRLAGYNADKR